MLTGLYLRRPVMYSGISARYLFKSIPPINLLNVKTGSSRSKQSEKNRSKQSEKNTDPNNLKKTVVNILFLDYNKCWVSFSFQVNFTTKIGPFA